MKTVLALDLGSTQLKLLLMDEEANVVYVGTQSYPTYTAAGGRIEQQPHEWLEALEKGMEALREAGHAQNVAAISFSGHMSGVVLVDAQGEVLYPCIMLADSRSETECGELRARVGDLVRERTGNPIINAFSLPKLLWLKKNEPKSWERTVCWLSPKDYLRYTLTGVMATEYTDAYNSLCVDAQTRDWCDEVIAGSDLERKKFPPMLAPDQQAGVLTQEAAGRLGLKAGIPVFAGGADMACGALGMGVFNTGDSALTLGTCATFFAPVLAPDEKHFGEVTFHLHAVPDLLYALGSHMNGGMAVNWFSSMLSEEEKLDFDLIRRLSDQAKEVPPGSEGLMILPFLVGSGSPYFSSDDRFTVLGASASTTRGQLFRSMLEGITLNLDQTRRAFEEMACGGLRRVLLGGGGCKIGVWPQMIADVFGMNIDVATNSDASAVGAAILGGSGAGMFADPKKTAQKCLKIRETLACSPAAKEAYASLAEKYERAYAALHALYAKE